MTAPYVRSPGNQFLQAFGGSYGQSYNGYLGTQARDEQRQLELRRMAIDQAENDRRFTQAQSENDRRFTQSQREYGDRQQQTQLGNALQGIAPQESTNGADTVIDPLTGQAHPRWIALAGTRYAQDWTRTPDYAAQTAKANQATENNALGNALSQVGAPAGVVAAARSGTLPKESANQYLSQPGAIAQQAAGAQATARATAQYREAPAGTVIQVPTDPNNPSAPVRDMLLDPRTGRARAITDQGTGQPLLGLPKGVAAPNATDRKDAALANSASTNMSVVDSILGGPRPPSALDLSLANHWFSRPFASSGAKQAQNAGGMATQDLGHLKAGARLPAPEFQRAYNSFIPQVGDDAATLQAKAGARALAKRAARTTAGDTPFIGTVPGRDAATDPFKKYRGLIPPGAGGP